MFITTVKKIALSVKEKDTLIEAKEILRDLADELDDDYYDGLADRIEEVYSRDSWETEDEE